MKQTMSFVNHMKQGVMKKTKTLFSMGMMTQPMSGLDETDGGALSMGLMKQATSVLEGPWV